MRDGSIGGIFFQVMDIYVRMTDAKDFDIKGNELILYSLIKQETELYGISEHSLSELAILIGITKGNVHKVIKRLSEKTLINVEHYTINGVKYNRYKAL